MPLLFPSHPGLIAPLWRRWPGALTPLAASVGAMAPDLVDGIVGLQRGHLGQAYGHSFFGLCILALPLGLAVNGAIQAVGASLARRDGTLSSRLSTAIRRWSTVEGVHGRALLLLEAWSVWFGALSSPGLRLRVARELPLALPVVRGRSVLSRLVVRELVRDPGPLLRGSVSCGPHFLVWVILSILGSVLFFAPIGGPSVPREDPVPREA